MTTIDDLLIRKIFSPLCGWAQHRLGVSQWQLSLGCLNGAIFFYLAAVALTIAGKGMRDGIFSDLLAALAWLLIMDFVRRVACRQAGSSMGVQTARLGEWLFRLILVAVLPLSITKIENFANLGYTLSLLCLVAHLYFKASDTPPPEQRGKFAYSRG
ncbi:MAG: hypothetical protein JWN69_1664 [Alphaproteobacteria bacterium]|nr:hypothetical protein [Alphaproteobacteria bacterium]